MYVQDIAKGRAFSYDDVKNQIKRELALEQLPQSVSPEAFGKNLTPNGFMVK